MWLKVCFFNVSIKNMNSKEIRQKFLDFFMKQGHKVVPSSSLIPDDPSVLLTTAGMQQFKPYYTGEADSIKDFGSFNTVSIQKSMRTSDIDEVGDETHNTFFEMLGNFSFGGYWKKEAIRYAYEFITKEMGLAISYVTVFRGSDIAPKDEESKKIWRLLGVADVREEGINDVFWGPTGNSGPCGPTTEIYCKNGKRRDVEIWNVVFNEFFCDSSRDILLNGGVKLKQLKKKGIDTGMGLERLTMISQNVENIFDIDLFSPIIKKIEELCGKSYEDNAKNFRIIADHMRGSVFLIGDGVLPSNIERGYILRRLLRRSIRYAKLLELPENWHKEIVKTIIENYKEYYPELEQREGEIINAIKEENDKFCKTLERGLKELGKIDAVDAEKAFYIFQTYGFPFEMIGEELKKRKLFIDAKEFQEEFKKHQEKSRAGLEKKFGGHGLIMDTGELKAGSEEEIKKATKFHTATHLMHQALRVVLGEKVRQMGSDINAERLRFDFTFDRKMTPEEIKKVEDLVNEKITENLEVRVEEMPYKKAMESGALAFFKGKYPEIVKVYSVGKFSKEVCGGPHASRTVELGKFKIKKEESSSAGVRRIRAILE